MAKAAAKKAKTAKTHFPNEGAAYRRARNRLLGAEKKLRLQMEAVAALRRRLPDGGRVAEDYAFDAPGGRSIRFSELFRDGVDTLVIYNYMYGPAMANPCTSCTSILDGLNGSAPHIHQRINFYVVARSPIGRFVDLAERRGWRNLKLLSSANNNYNRDYYGENEKGGQMPSLNVFRRRQGRIHHFYQTELMFHPERGMDNRHVDLIWPVWNMFDYTPEGRGKDWYPKLEY